MYSFYYTCTIDLKLKTPTCRTPAATAYKGEDNIVAGAGEVAAQTLVFEPLTDTGLLQMAFTGTLNPLLKGVQFVTFTYDILGNAALNEDLSIFLDDFDVTVKPLIGFSEMRLAILSVMWDERG